MNTEPNSSLLLWLWSTLAALAGTVSSLSFRPYRTMSRIDIILSLIVSLTFAIFVGSLVAEWVARWFDNGVLNIKVYGATMWFLGASAHYLIPVAIGRVRRSIDSAKPEALP